MSECWNSYFGDKEKKRALKKQVKDVMKRRHALDTTEIYEMVVVNVEGEALTEAQSEEFFRQEIKHITRK